MMRLIPLATQTGTSLIEKLLEKYRTMRMLLERTEPAEISPDE